VSYSTELSELFRLFSYAACAVTLVARLIRCADVINVNCRRLKEAKVSDPRTPFVEPTDTCAPHADRRGSVGMVNALEVFELRDAQH
jgi:hypothetical protein